MKTKVVSLAISLILIGLAAAAQLKPFTIDGKIKGFSDSYIYINYMDELSGKRLMDSSLIKNGHFTFNGKISGPTQAYVMTDKQSLQRDKVIEIYIVPGKMALDLDYNRFSESAVLKGSYVQEEANILNKSKAGILVTLKPFSEAYDKANTEYIEAKRGGKDEQVLEEYKNKATAAQEAMEPYYDELRKIDEEFMNKYPSSYVTASMLRYKISRMPLQEGEERYSKLSDDIVNSGLGKEIKKELEGLRMGSPGAKAYVFESTELRGEPLSLADYRGKYVLVDFWASWCVPCRKGNPHLLSLYEKYKDRGFEIIGVSDDDSNHDAWRQAVEKDGIGVWKHILRGLKYDGKEFDRTNDISDQYGIHTLPTKILIDPSGMIIGRYGGGGENDEAMDKKLSEIFGG